MKLKQKAEYARPYLIEYGSINALTGASNSAFTDGVSGDGSI